MKRYALWCCILSNKDSFSSMVRLGIRFELFEMLVDQSASENCMWTSSRATIRVLLHILLLGTYNPYRREIWRVYLFDVCAQKTYGWESSAKQVFFCRAVILQRNALMFFCKLLFKKGKVARFLQALTWIQWPFIVRLNDLTRYLWRTEIDFLCRVFCR